MDQVGCSLIARVDVKFENNSSVILPESAEALDRVVTFLGNATTAVGVLEGHTDSVGSDAFNLALSQRRADAVRQYLVDKGVAGSRLTAIGYGETMPEADNATAEGRAANRRVVLRRTDTR